MPMYRASSDTIVCRLNQVELRDTRYAWQKLFRTALISRDEIPGGIRLVVNEGSAVALRQLVEVERDCCQWINFDLDGSTVSMTADEAGAAAIRQMWVVDAL